MRSSRAQDWEAACNSLRIGANSRKTLTYFKAREAQPTGLPPKFPFSEEDSLLHSQLWKSLCPAKGIQGVALPYDLKEQPYTIQ